jgi:hypothetical protein
MLHVCVCMHSRFVENHPIRILEDELLISEVVLSHSALSRVSRFRIRSPCSVGLQCCHVFRGSRSCLPFREGSGAATCPVAPDPASLFRRAPALPRVPRHRPPPPCSGGLRCCHVSCGSLWAVDIKNKERLSWSTYAARLACL